MKNYETRLRSTALFGILVGSLLLVTATVMLGTKLNKRDPVVAPTTDTNQELNKTLAKLDEYERQINDLAKLITEYQMKNWQHDFDLISLRLNWERDKASVAAIKKMLCRERLYVKGKIYYVDDNLRLHALETGPMPRENAAEHGANGAPVGLHRVDSLFPPMRNRVIRIVPLTFPDNREQFQRFWFGVGKFDHDIDFVPQYLQLDPQNWLNAVLTGKEFGPMPREINPLTNSSP